MKQMKPIIKQLEGGLTERQKILARHIIVQMVADILQEETPAETEIYAYEDLYNLTQTESFVAWQKRVLARPSEGEENPGTEVLGAIIQLESSDLVLQAINGYISYLRRQLASALDNVRAAGHAVIAAYDGQITSVQTKDKDNVTWQMYTSPATPDSVKTRRYTTTETADKDRQAVGKKRKRLGGRVPKRRNHKS